MDHSTEDRIEILAPQDEVLAVICDVESYPEWAGVRSVDVRSRDETGRVTKAAFEVSAGGIDASYTLQYQYEPDGGGISWVSTEAGGAVRDVKGGYSLAPTGKGTSVTYRMTVQPAIPLPGFLRRRAEQKIVHTALEGLKRRVEQV